jgi:putative flippase GtrA
MLLSALQSLPISDANRREVKRFIKFAIVGAAGMLTHLTIFNILLALRLYPAAWWPNAANAIGFSIAVMQNFSLNRRWTFPESRSRGVGGQLGQFILVSLVGLAINSAVFWAVNHLLESFWTTTIANTDVAHVIGNNFALASAIGVVLFWNFTINRLWTFRSHA